MTSSNSKQVPSVDKEVIVFDLDHTLLRCNLSFEFGKYLYRQRCFSRLKCLALVLCYVMHTMHLFSLKWLHRRSFNILFYKKRKEGIEKQASSFIQKVLPLLLRKSVLALLQEAQRKGNVILLLSSSPDFLVEKVAKELDIAHVFASVYSEDQNRCFAQVTVMDGDRKKETLKKFLAEYEIVPKNIIVYTDSYLDMPILEMATVPLLVCPDRILRRIAIARKWNIIEA